MSSPEDLAKELWDGDPTSTAQKILRRLQVSARASEVLLPWVADGVLNIQRNNTRRIERGATRLGGVTNAQARQMLTAETFSIGDGKFVTWGQATAEQHRARISLLISYRNGVDDTIARHQEAIAVIESSGVDCLDEVQAASA